MDLDRFHVVQQDAKKCSLRTRDATACVDCCYGLYGVANAPLRPSSAGAPVAQQYCLQRCNAMEADRQGMLLYRIANEIAMLGDAQAAHAVLSQH